MRLDKAHLFSGFGLEYTGRLSALEKWLLRSRLRYHVPRLLELHTRAIQIAEKPLWKAIPTARKLDQQMDRMAFKVEWPFLGLKAPDMNLLPSVLTTLLAEAQSRALLDSMRLALSVRQYHEDDGEKPASLAELTPEYLDALPKDPFTGRGYLMNIRGDSVTIYSVGRNCDDDGGDVGKLGKPWLSPDIGVRIGL